MGQEDRRRRKQKDFDDEKTRPRSTWALRHQMHSTSSGVQSVRKSRLRRHCVFSEAFVPLDDDEERHDNTTLIVIIA